MNQTTASIQLEYEDGYQYYITDYLSECGCHWRVDMWGNVRSVKICHACTMARYPWEDQVSLFME